ncbi:MAG: hypothetical protein H0U98_05520, partial [Alphaproteobacteria bacterium]|nr:hypothetical protein [Alphaproteobacteria bacterium]
QMGPSGVVMQRVPVDPLAGPVMGPAIAAAKPPRPLAPSKVATKTNDKPAQTKGNALDTSTARSESPKPAPATATAPGVKTAASQAEDLQARAETLAKQLTNKPAAIAAVKAEASKEPVKTEANGAPRVLPSPVKAADAKPMPPAVAPASHVAPPAPVKAAEAKPAAPAAPHVLPEKTAAAPGPAQAQTKTAAAPAPKVLPPAPAKTATAKAKDSVPALRVSSSAY